MHMFYVYLCMCILYAFIQILSIYFCLQIYLEKCIW